MMQHNSNGFDRALDLRVFAVGASFEAIVNLPELAANVAAASGFLLRADQGLKPRLYFFLALILRIDLVGGIADRNKRGAQFGSFPCEVFGEW